jgi:hypothetical protein
VLLKLRRRTRRKIRRKMIKTVMMKNQLIATQSANGNVTPQSATKSALQFANHQSATLVAKNWNALFVISSAELQSAKYVAQPTNVNPGTVQTAALLVLIQFATLNARIHLQLVNQFAKNQFVTGNASAQMIALSQSVPLSVKPILDAITQMTRRRLALTSRLFFQTT